MDTLSPAEKSELVEQVFGALRAESLRSEIYHLFSHPSYFPQLMGPGACVLVGGRGTGKTTVLRGLSYEGQLQLNPDKDFSDWESVGLYWRVDTTMVTAFRGSELSEEHWTKLFSHYFNVTMVQLVVDFLGWLDEKSVEPIPPASFRRACVSLGIEPASNLIDFKERLDDLLLELEGVMNNVSRITEANLSRLGRPVRYLLDDLQSISMLHGKYFVFLIDEYESLDRLQQRIVNTLVKHSGDYPYTFKIGVKELGHRDRATLQPDEYLVAPADYTYIDITEKLVNNDFAAFARSVCDHRLAKLRERFEVPETIEELLPGLSTEAEAYILGAKAYADDVAHRLQAQGATVEQLAEYQSMPLLSACLVGYWAESKGQNELSVFYEAAENSQRWNNRLNNYQHAMLFTIRRGKRGVQKYYSGWSTYVKLAHGNIRILLQLVHQALQEHLQSGGPSTGAISAGTQTLAAAAVGQRTVEQLQGISANGRDLTKLVLGLGRIFEVMATQPHGHAPEVSQFRVVGNESPAAEELLQSAVMHLAARRMPTDKRAAVSDEVKGFSYQLHPVFAPFFGYSYRSKRRMDLTSTELMDLVNNHQRAISLILGRSARKVDSPLPVQLSLFRTYYESE